MNHGKGSIEKKISKTNVQCFVVKKLFVAKNQDTMGKTMKSFQSGKNSIKKKKKPTKSYFWRTPTHAQLFFSLSFLFSVDLFPMMFFPQIYIFVPLSLWDWCEIENSLFRFEALISVSDAKFFPFWKLFLQLPRTQIFQKCVLLLWKRWIMLITWMNWQISEKTQKSANLWISYWQNSWNIVGHKYSQNDYII